MKKFTQKQFANVLGCGQPSISRYLTNTRDISLKDSKKIEAELKVPAEIFIDPELQIQYFGKSFISKSNCNTSKKCEQELPKKQKN